MTLLSELVAQGFVNYNKLNNEVYLRDKVFHYVRANDKKEDYDVIKIFSETKDQSGYFSLRDTIVTIDGVRLFEFSESQKVGIKPLGEFIRMARNRNIFFNGRLYVGYAVLTGNDFKFTYDEFKVDLDSARYLDIGIPNTGATFKSTQQAQTIDSRIEYVSGAILIDAPNNKSGTEKLPQFPSLATKKESFVFYDRTEAQGGLYTRDSFMFRLDRFTFNSLDSFELKDIKFKGTLVSAKIFPDIKETIVIRPDTSLGFVTRSPQAGWPIYTGKGTYIGEADLSNNGLLGKGNLTYLGSNLNSEAFIFRPKQMLATAKRFDLKEDREGLVKYPQAVGSDVLVDWKPYKDSMYVSTREKPFDLYKANKHTLAGTLILTPVGLRGLGVFDWDKAKITSRMFAFGYFSVSADTMNLNIKTLDAGSIALDMNNIKGVIDFETEQGKFEANADTISARLPALQYQTTMNRFDWDFKRDLINFHADKDKLAGFLSIHPDQDSLNFNGQTALYDLKAATLKIGGVPYIQTCDAYVYPEAGKVEITENAVMTTLANATILCDTINQYHRINRAIVDVKGQKLYTAKGYYEYNIGKRNQEIYFDNVVGQRVGKGSRAEKNTVTRATGVVKDADKFYIDHQTEFVGTIALNADSRNLQFEGYARLDASGLPYRDWFSVNSGGDKNNLSIAYNVPRNYASDPLFTGFFVNRASMQLYPRVMMSLFQRKDRTIMDGRGVFRYSQTNDEFIFGDSSKVLLGGKTGTKIIFQNKYSRLTGEGPLNIIPSMKYAKAKFAGLIETEFLSEEAYKAAPIDTLTNMVLAPGTATLVTATAGIIFEKIPEKMLRIAAADLQASSFDAPDIAYLGNEAFYEASVAEFIPDLKDYISVIAETKARTLVMPSKYNPYHFFFSRIRLKWDAENQSFVSNESRIGVNSIAGMPINKQLTGYAEFRMPNTEDDRCYIYLKTNSELFYFFGYNGGILSMSSNNPKFRAEFDAIKEKDRIFKMPDGENLEIQFVEPSSAAAFVTRVQEAQARK